MNNGQDMQNFITHLQSTILAYTPDGCKERLPT